MFESRSIVEHLGRGAIGVGAIGIAAAFAADNPWTFLVALPAAIIAFRGCPLCWTVGLVETAAAKVRGRPATGSCVDGSCQK